MNSLGDSHHGKEHLEVEKPRKWFGGYRVLPKVWRYIIIMVKKFGEILFGFAVSLFAREWIEIRMPLEIAIYNSVSLFAREWIEISMGGIPIPFKMSPSSRGSGLKFHIQFSLKASESLPLREGVD